jgi:hypothetical protein
MRPAGPAAPKGLAWNGARDLACPNIKGWCGAGPAAFVIVQGSALRPLFRSLSPSHTRPIACAACKRMCTKRNPDRGLPPYKACIPPAPSYISSLQACACRLAPALCREVYAAQKARPADVAARAATAQLPCVLECQLILKIS